MDIRVEHTPSVIAIMFLVLFMVMTGMVILKTFSAINNKLHSPLLDRIVTGDVAMISAFAVVGAIVIFVYAYRVVQGE